MAVKEAARNMSYPKVFKLRRLRNIKVLARPAGIRSELQCQAMLSTTAITFTDSGRAGIDRSAKLTSGGAIAVCIGEDVKQQEVIASSSVEAELYAMVAASAEVLALAVCSCDLGIELVCELYCDSAAALVIVQRAGIEKV